MARPQVVRILHVVAIPDAVNGGGLIERTLHLARALTAKGATTAVLTLDIGLTAARRRDFEGTELHVVPCLNRRYVLPGTRPARLMPILAGFDVIELTGHWSLLNAAAYRAARRLKKPMIVRPAGALGVVGRSTVVKRLYNRVVGHAIIRDADGYVSVASSEMAEYARYGVSADRLTLIPNGIDVPAQRPLDCADFLQRHGLTGRRFILFMGRLSYIKGPDLLLQAFADVTNDLPEHSLVFAGPDDGLRAALERLVEDRGLGDRVRFVGYLGGADKACAYQASDFLALPSRREAMSIVALEAGAAGTPVLLTDQCGFDDIETCKGGRVVAATAAALGEGLRDMVAKKDGLREMGNALRAHVAEHYTWPRAADSFLALCHRALRAQGPAT